MINTQSIDWQKVNGLLPVIAQDFHTSQVLMLGYMNEDALHQTLKQGTVTFFSRTKNRLWTKGETSGNYLRVVDMGLDCDNDTLLILVNPIGATCHTGADSCFYQVKTTPDWVFFAGLEKLIASRQGADPSSSYTAALYAQGTKRIAQKVAEEGVETALAATVKDKKETINEAADLLYHLTVLLQDGGIAWADVIETLRERQGGK